MCVELFTVRYGMEYLYTFIRIPTNFYESIKLINDIIFSILNYFCFKIPIRKYIVHSL